MKRQAFSKQHRLRKSREFQEVYVKGFRLRGDHFSLICAPNGRCESRLGISVHGYKEAVKRNRIKRIVREFYRLHMDITPPATDIVFAVRRGFSLKSPGEIEQAVRPLFEKYSHSRKHC